MNAPVDPIGLSRALPAWVRSAGVTDFRMPDTFVVKALDCLAEGVVITDRRGSPLIVNQAAAAIVQETDGLQIGPAGISTADADTTTTIRRMIITASESNGVGASSTMHLSRPSGRRPLCVIIGPIRSPRCESAEGRPSAIVLIRDLERWPSVSAPVLRQLYGLTRTEAAVAVEVLRGEGLSVVARRLGIGRTTVRTHVQRIFHKTGVRRQAELVFLIAQGCGWLRFVDFAADVAGQIERSP